MSEQQSGAGYPQQPSQPQQAYQQQAYASPQAQYQAQQQYAYAQPAGPSLFDKLGVPAVPAILGLSGLAALILAGLIGGTSSGSADTAEWADLDTSDLSSYVLGQISVDLLSILAAVIGGFALVLFTGEKLRNLWKVVVLAGASLFVAKTLFYVLALPDRDSASDASAWIALLLLVGAYGLFTAGALLVPGKPGEAPQPAQPQGYPTGQQPAVQPQAPQAPQAQQQQWPQAPQQ